MMIEFPLAEPAPALLRGCFSGLPDALFVNAHRFQIVALGIKDKSRVIWLAAHFISNTGFSIVCTTIRSAFQVSSCTSRLSHTHSPRLWNSSTA